MDPAVLHKKAKQRMKSLDFDAALPLLEQLKGDPTLSPERRLDVLLDLGITHVNLGQTEEAKRDFDDALGLNENARPPSNASPKVQRVFEEAKEAREVRLRPPPPPEPKPEPPPLPPVSLTPAPAAQQPVVVEEPPAPPRQRLVAVPLVMMLAGAGCVAAGAIFALQSQSAARELQSSLHPSAEVMALEGKRSTFAALGYGGYALGGALAAAGLAILVFSGTF